MAYSKSLGSRISQILGFRHGIFEKKMFGGVCFLLNGNICVGIWTSSLIARIGLESYEDALKEEYVREFELTGRPMKGWVIVEPDGIETNEQLSEWVRRSDEFVSTLPKK